MKKMLIFALCMLMMLSLGAALAENAAHPAESMYEGAWVKFEDGFEIYLPADWYEFECTEEMNAQGIFYMAGTEDLSYCCTLAWAALEEECTVEELHAEMVTAYPNAQIMSISDASLVYYEDAENNMMNYLALDATEPGVYMFAFSPADDAVFNARSAMIASSIRCF